jgi:hypothetical protein
LYNIVKEFKDLKWAKLEGGWSQDEPTATKSLGQDEMTSTKSLAQDEMTSSTRIL